MELRDDETLRCRNAEAWYPAVVAGEAMQERVVALAPHNARTTQLEAPLAVARVAEFVRNSLKTSPRGAIERSSREEDTPDEAAGKEAGPAAWT